jgi:hypothetical protein
VAPLCRHGYEPWDTKLAHAPRPDLLRITRRRIGRTDREKEFDVSCRCSGIFTATQSALHRAVGTDPCSTWRCAWMGALADRLGDALAPDFSNRITDGRWLTILAWCLCRSHAAFHKTGRRNVDNRLLARERYTWLRPLELMWVCEPSFFSTMRRAVALSQDSAECDAGSSTSK